MSNPSALLKRRQVVTALGSMGAVALFGCGSTDATGEGSAGASGAGTAGNGGGGAAGSGSDAWATEGTSVLTGQDYGNPFADGVGPTCKVYKSSTGGPCHATSDLLLRKDVSEGYEGLPMRLELLVVDDTCTPVPNATVEIWMCDTLGVYSGDIDGSNDAFCTGGDAKAAAALWGRGIQTAGEDGRVTFDANFPGWYSGRATHIHFEVSVGSTAYVTSQLFFDEAIKAEIYNAQPNYKPVSGQGYVANANDNVIKQASLTVADVAVNVAKQSDGALLAWMAITVNG